MSPVQTVTHVSGMDRSNWLPGHGVITNCISTLVYICHKRAWKEKRYSLSTDFAIEKEKINPIAQARYFHQLKMKNPNFNNAYLSKILGISRVRITQILNLLKLAPDIQERILSAQHYTERQLRPLTQINGFDGQRKMFKAMGSDQKL